MLEDFANLDVMLVCGNYHSGKELLVKKYFESFKRINRNEIRQSLKTMLSHGKPWVPGDYNEKLESIVKSTEFMLFSYLLEQNQKVVIDNTSITRRNRFQYIKEAQQHKKLIGCIFVDVPLESILDRNNRSQDIEKMPEKVLTDIDFKKELPDKDEGFDTIRILKQ